MPLNSHNSNGQNQPRNLSTEKNPSFVYSHAKAERLATAIYLVTRYISAADPLRTKLREESLDLLASMTVLEEGGIGTNKALESLQKIISLLDIAYRTNHISEMNWTVIRREYIGLRMYIEERGGTTVEQTPQITEDFFKVDETPKLSKVESSLKAVLEVAEEKKDSIVKIIKDKPKRHTTNTVAAPAKTPLVTQKKTNRRDVILDLIKQKTSVTVRDVADVIDDCSEKTLQRELLAMVGEKILKKEGERRWSTYSIA